MQQLISLLQSSIWFGTVILYGALGEILTEKGGNLNLGVPGIMSLGAIGGLMGSFFYETRVENPSAAVCLFVTLLSALALSVLGGLIYSFLTITLRANQNVTGLTLTIFAGGFANFFGGSLNKLAGGVGQINVSTTSAAFRATLPFVQDLPALLRMLLGFGFMVYLAVVVALVVSWFLNRSSVGLNLRAVGENPATADAAGVNVTAYKYLATLVGGMLAGLGGLYFVMEYTGGTWVNNGFGDRGWLAIALVIFARWRPLNAIWGSILFGGLYILYLYIPGLDRSMQEIFKALPYVVTIVVLVITSLRKKREDQPPMSLGVAYFREDRG